MSARLQLICGFDVLADGSATKIKHPDDHETKGAAYRWLHFDLRDKGVTEWLDAHLPPLPAATLKTIETRPRVVPMGDGLLATLRGINLNEGANAADMVAVRVWMTRALVVTVRRRRIFAVDDLRTNADAGQAPASPAQFLADLCDGLVGRIETVSLALETQTDKMEAAIYDHGGETLADLSERRRNVIKLRRHVGPQTDALHALATCDSPVIPVTLRPTLAEIANRATRSVEELAEVRERLTALSDHLDLLQTARLGRNGYVLSVIAAIFLPLGFLTGLFGVNLGGMPGTGSPMAFAALCLGVVAIGAALYIYFRWRRWL